MPIDNKGANNPMFGRKHSDETKRKIAESRQKYTKEKSFKWKGGRRTNHHGYIEIFMPEHHRARANGYVFEHILIAEQKLNRWIFRDEDVHHIDENKQNNHPDNLLVISHKEHTKMHPRIRTGETKKCVICNSSYYVKASDAAISKTCSLRCNAYLSQKKRRERLNNAK